jgi:hypothetical protein
VGGGALKDTSVAAPCGVGATRTRLTGRVVLGWMSGAARLWEAAERGDAVAVQEELDRGTPVDAAGRTAWTALHREWNCIASLVASLRGSGLFCGC